MTPAQSKIKVWRENPLRFCWDNFQIDLDEWQKDACEPLGGAPNPRRRVAMRACTGPGKTAVLAMAGWHRLTCFAEEGEHPKGAALSGEGRENLSDNLWAELAKWQERSPFLKKAFTWTKRLIYANGHPETWFLSARSYAHDPDSQALARAISGLHSKFPFLLLDEIGRMPIEVGQKAEQIFTGGVKDGLILAAGNPVSHDGLLFHICTVLGEQWIIITVTADPNDPKRTPRVPIDHAREQIRIHGRDDHWVMSTILGLFPPTSLNKLLGPDEVRAAIDRGLRDGEFEFAQKRLGVDVARFGDDRTVIFPRQGLCAFNPIEMRGAKGNEVAARIMMVKSKWQSEMEFIDDSGGYGSSVIDSLIQAGQSPLAVSFSGKPADPRYLNKRAEIWLEMANWVKRGGSLPDIPELVKDLTTPTYTFTNGKFALESKDQIKARLGSSPDYGDALALTFSLPEMPASMSHIFGNEQNKTKFEYDPFDPDRV